MIKYTIKKSHFDNEYILWKTTTTERGIGFKNKFKGSYGECIEHKKTLEEKEKKTWKKLKKQKFLKKKH